MSGTRHSGIGYPNDLPNRTSTGILKKPTVIDRAWENWSLHDVQDQKSGSLSMPSRRQSTRAREQLLAATPICDDASLVKVERDAAEFLREASRRDALPPDELFSAVIDALARGYFRHMLRKQELRRQERVTPVRRRMRA
jgi:hypothetical protein